MTSSKRIDTFTHHAVIKTYKQIWAIIPEWLDALALCLYCFFLSTNNNWIPNKKMRANTQRVNQSQIETILKQNSILRVKKPSLNDNDLQHCSNTLLRCWNEMKDGKDQIEHFHGTNTALKSAPQHMLMQMYYNISLFGSPLNPLLDDN